MDSFGSSFRRAGAALLATTMMHLAMPTHSVKGSLWGVEKVSSAELTQRSAPGWVNARRALSIQPAKQQFALVQAAESSQESPLEMPWQLGAVNAAAMLLRQLHERSRSVWRAVNAPLGSASSLREEAVPSASLWMLAVVQPIHSKPRPV